MNNAIYIALARQTGLFRNMDVVANNVANVNTPGFKGETMVFEQFLADDKDRFHKEIAFSHDVATYTDYKTGAAKPTGNPLDMALDGEGFFKIKTPDGIRYTRSGNFHVSPDGELVTADGYAVLGGANETIRIQPEDIDILVSSDGTLLVSQAGEVGSTKQARGNIGVVTFDAPQKLVRVDGGYYKASDPESRDKEPGKIIQGSLEQSNVSSINELTSLININRSVGSVTGFMADMHELTRRAITAYTRST